jgi:predicted Zn finger-like uncharacterized protein
MILTCPDCASSYFVDDKVMTAPRAVRCTACGKRWTADPTLDLVSTPEEGAIAVEPAKPAAPVAAPEPTLSELPGEELPKAYRARVNAERRLREAAGAGIIWAGMAAAMAVVVVAAVIFRVDLVRIWPRTAGAFASVGLPVNHVGLVIEGLKAEPSLQDGHAALTISGILRNIEDHPVEAPPLRISLLNPAGKRVAGKIAAAADPLVPPGETRHFSIAIVDPPSTAKDLEIGFVVEAGAARAVKASVAAPPGDGAAQTHELRGIAEPAHETQAAPHDMPAAATPPVIDAKPLPIPH